MGDTTPHIDDERPEGLLAFPPRTAPDPATGKRRRLDKSDRIRSEARRKFDEALAEYERTGRVRTNRVPLLRDWLDRWLEEYKRPNIKPRVYETYRSDCRNIADTIGNVRLRDLEPRHVRGMGNTIMRDRSGKTALNAYIRLRIALTDAARGARRAQRVRPVRPAQGERQPHDHPRGRAACRTDRSHRTRTGGEVCAPPVARRRGGPAHVGPHVAARLWYRHAAG